MGTVVGVTLALEARGFTHDPGIGLVEGGKGIT